MAAKEHNNKLNTNQSKGRDMIFYLLYLILLLLPQYFKGGFFEFAYIPFIIGISILMLYHIWKTYIRPKDNIIVDQTDLFLLLLVILYALSFFYGISKRGAILEFLKNASYLAVFFIARDIHKDKNMRNKTIDIILLAGVILSIIGVGTMIGTWDYVGSYNGSRLSSSFQYPNTLAVYAAAMYFLAMGQALVNHDPKKIGLYGGSLFVFFSTLIFTYSRGMWVLFPLILVIFFVVLASAKKVELFFYALTSLIIATPLSFLFMRYLGSGSSSKLWGLYIGGILLSALLLFLMGNATKLLSRISLKAVIAIILIIAIGAVGLLLMAISAREPLVYENASDERVVSQVSRNVKEVYPNSSYQINIKGSATLAGEDSYAGRVLIYSVDEEAKNTSLEDYRINEAGDFDLDIDITSLEDTNNLLIRFRNEVAHTSITFTEASIMDMETGESYEIPLKYKYIPESIITRISGIGSSEGSFQARLIFSKDALKLVNYRLLFGLGGEGWNTAYRSVQSYPYFSSQVHNHYLQLFVELGLVGLILFLGFILSLIYKYFRFVIKEEDISKRTLADSLAIACLTILAHAAIDFDLSYVGLSVILFALLGILDSLVRIPKDKLEIFKFSIKKNQLRKINIPLIVLLIITLGLSSSIYAARYMKDEALKHEQEGDMDEVESAMEKAVRLDPYNRDHRVNLMNVYFYQYETLSDQEYGYKAKVQADKMIDMGKYDPRIHIEAASAYLKFGLLDEALDLINKSLEMQPLTIESYIQNVDSHISVSNYHIRKGNLEEAQSIATEGAERLEGLLLESNERSLRPLARNNQLYLKISELKYYSKEIDEFGAYFDRGYDLVYAYDFDLDVEQDGSIELVSIWNADAGKLGYQTLSDGDDYIRLVNPGENYGVFDVLAVDLKPETTYLVAFNGRGNIEPEKGNYYMIDTKSEEQQQSESKTLELSDDWANYEVEFTTKADIGERTSRFRYVIRGENEGHVDLRNIKIFEKVN